MEAAKNAYNSLIYPNVEAALWIALFIFLFIFGISRIILFLTFS